MSRMPKPFTIPRRSDSKTFQITLNLCCGLPDKVCRQWKRRSFLDLPPELSQFRYPKTKAAAEAGTLALIEFLKNTAESVSLSTDTIRVGARLEKFTSLEGKPRAARNVAKNRPYSINTIVRYAGLYSCYIKGDPFTQLRMNEIEESDALEFISRLARMNMKRRDYKTKELAGTETFEKIVKLFRTAFHEYQKSHPKWHNAFRGIDPPKHTQQVSRDALTEAEVVALFNPDVLRDTMELAVCGAMFLAGLRRGRDFCL
jgi:hypothetical protein